MGGFLHYPRRRWPHALQSLIPGLWRRYRRWHWDNSEDRSCSSPALSEGRHSNLARRSVAVCGVVVFVVPNVQRPHPGPCGRHTRVEDTADNFTIGQYIIIVVPFAGGTGSRCASQSEIVLLHRIPSPALIEGTPAPPEKPG